VTTTTEAPAVEQEQPLGYHIQTCKVADLQAHPLSFELFGVLPDDQFQSLKTDIGRRGLQYPLESDAKLRIICGSQRLRAVQELMWDDIELVVRDNLTTEDEVEEHLILDNVQRRQLTPSQMFRAGVELERIEAARAKQRQVSAGDQAPLDANAAKGKAADLAAQTMGISGDTFRRIKKIFQSENDQVKDQLDRGELSISAAAQKIRPPKLTTRKLAGDDPRAQALRFAKFEKEAENFEKWIKANHPAKFDAHEPEARNRLQRLSNRLQEALAPAEKAE